MTQTEAQLRMDRMRYTKNKLSANLVLLSIVFNALYFVSLYQSDVASYYYNYLTGASIIYNLVFMLAAFLCSEGVKSRKGNFWPALTVLGVGQIVRMFVIPARAHAAVVKISGVETLVMGNGQYAYIIVCLALSAACCLGAAATSFAQNRALRSYMANAADAASK